MSDFDRVREAADEVRARCGEAPQAAIVLGSGLGAFADTLDDAVSLPYSAIPHWPASQVPGHAGRLVVGSVKGTRVAALAGRGHAYEGNDAATVVLPVRTLGLLGVKTLVLTNAAGGVNTRFPKGALMAIEDHINLTGTSPLVGPNEPRFGPRFPDMSEVYSARLRALAGEAARAAGQTLEHGVYAGVLGPSYETPAEIRYLRTIGADAVGMSTVLEAIAARHMGIEVLGIACITNMAAGVLAVPLDHDEVMATAHQVRGRLAALLEGIVERI